VSIGGSGSTFIRKRLPRKSGIRRFFSVKKGGWRRRYIFIRPSREGGRDAKGCAGRQLKGALRCRNVIKRARNARGGRVASGAGAGPCFSWKCKERGKRVPRGERKELNTACVQTRSSASRSEKGMVGVGGERREDRLALKDLY